MHKEKAINKFSTDGFLTLNSFLLSEEKRILKEVIFSNFCEDLQLNSIESFELENQSFHDKLIKLRKNNIRHCKIPMTISYRD